MCTTEEFTFLHWLEDNHAEDMQGLVVRTLPDAEQEIAWRLVADDVIDSAQSLQTGTEETVIRARGCWLLHQWDRTKIPLPLNAEEVQVYHQGFDDPAYYVIQRLPGPLSNLAILQLILERDANPPYHIQMVETAAETIVEAMEQLDGTSYNERFRRELLRRHPY